MENKPSIYRHIIKAFVANRPESGHISCLVEPFKRGRICGRVKNRTVWGESMKVYENGIYRDMTPEEIAELERLAAEAPAPEPSPEERIAALEQDNAELRSAIEALISGVTE